MLTNSNARSPANGGDKKQKMRKKEADTKIPRQKSITLLWDRVVRSQQLSVREQQRSECVAGAEELYRHDRNAESRKIESRYKPETI
jgi:hypothetical protein